MGDGHPSPPTDRRTEFRSGIYSETLLPHYYLNYRYPPLAVPSDIYSMVLCHGTPDTERNKDMLRVHVESSLDISLFMVQSIV